VTDDELDAIGSITVDNDVTGTVTVFIERDTDDDSPGATHVGSIDLTNSHATPVVGNLAELRITGDLATLAACVVANVTGDISVAGHLSVSSALDRTFTANSVTGDINLGGCGVIS
jgi:hypothetical protein